MSKVAPYIDRIVSLVQGGMLVTEALATDPAFPRYATLMAHLRSHPADRARLDAARQPDQRSSTGRHFEAILELIRGGMQMKEACESNPDFPKYTTFQKFIFLNPDYRARLDEARNLDIGEVLARRHWPAFVAAIAEGGSLVATCEAFGFATTAVYRLIEIEPGMRAEYKAAVSAKALIRLKRAREREQARQKPVYGYAMLKTSLSRNDLYRAAQAVVPSRVDPTLREDMISEIVIAVVEGRLLPEEIASEGYDIARQYVRRNSMFEFSSIETSGSSGEEDYSLSRYDQAGLVGWSFEGVA